MNILICYASTEGQTRKIAKFCAACLQARAHTCTVMHADDETDLEIKYFDAAILAGSVHIGHLQEPLAKFARTHAGHLNSIPTLFLQVSLAAAGQEASDHAELAQISRQFCEDAGWVPGETHQIAGAFRFTEYDFFKSLAMRFIAASRGQKVDPHKDTEFTDWPALSEIVRTWSDGF